MKSRSESVRQFENWIKKIKTIRSWRILFIVEKKWIDERTDRTSTERKNERKFDEPYRSVNVEERKKKNLFVVFIWFLFTKSKVNFSTFETRRNTVGIVVVLFSIVSIVSKSETPAPVRTESSSEFVRSILHRNESIEDFFQSFRLKVFRRTQTMFSVPFQMFVSDQSVRQSPAKTSQRNRTLILFERRQVFDVRFQNEFPSIDQTFANDVEENIDDRMPLVSFDVEKTNVRRVRWIEQL